MRRRKPTPKNRWQRQEGTFLPVMVVFFTSTIILILAFFSLLRGTAVFPITVFLGSGAVAITALTTWTERLVIWLQARAAFRYEFGSYPKYASDRYVLAIRQLHNQAVDLRARFTQEKRNRFWLAVGIANNAGCDIEFRKLDQFVGLQFMEKVAD